MVDNFIAVEGAKQNNLKNLNIRIPLNEITVITGVSGSGKSSLAFDTLYAEGQRRYVESFSAYARQFLDRMDKPNVERIEGIPPAIAIDQTNPVKNSRSTVGTMTEITDHMKLLFAKIGKLYCKGCGHMVERDTAETVFKKLLDFPEGIRMVITFPINLSTSLKASLKGISSKEAEEYLKRLGFHRIFRNGEVLEIEDNKQLTTNNGQWTHIVVDRFTLRKEEKKRIIDSLEQAFKFGKGYLSVFLESVQNVTIPSFFIPPNPLPRKTGEREMWVMHSPPGERGHLITSSPLMGEPSSLYLPLQGKSRGGGVASQQQELRFSTLLHCAQCDIAYEEPHPNMFSFNSPLGACDQCRGFGRTIDIDLDLIIPDRTKSIKEGAVRPWRGHAGEWEQQQLIKFCRKKSIPIDVPFEELRKEQKALIIEGDGHYYGIRGFFKWLETKTYKMPVRVFLSKYRSYVKCTDCNGTRFKPLSLLYRINAHAPPPLPSPSRGEGEGGGGINGKNIAEIYSMSVKEAHGFFENLALSPFEDKVAEILIQEIRSRLHYLMDVGLEYLTLDRQSRTLSGGEVQRVNLTTAIGSSLVNTLYILDEPSIGLHPRDSHRLVKILHRLKENKNTVVVVEHDPEIIKESDHIIDLGPGAGEAGGNLVFSGSFEYLLHHKESLTGQYLSGDLSIPIPEKRRRPQPSKSIKIIGACHNNLKRIDLEIPLGMMVCITGVSGSGKSTLVEDVIYNGIKKKKGEFVGIPGECDSILGTENINDVIMVDQSPIGRTPRANPVTYIKAYDHIRKLFASEPLSMERRYTPSTFSFNVEGGRCEYCKGEGFEKVEMQFLSDVYITCPDCDGSRFKKEILEVLYKGKSIKDVLDMTVSEALEFFKDNDKVGARLASSLLPLSYVGLNYIRLGQPINTLSGGESQRLKLAYYMGKGGQNNLFIFDEPTTGLHFEDIKNLLWAFERLLNQGHSLIIIEHNMEVIKWADYLIDLGPEGGDEGGRVVTTGSPEEVAQCPHSYTGRYLKTYLTRNGGQFLPSLTKQRSRDGRDNHICIIGAREHNLKNIELKIPRDKTVVVTGLSGSGKSTLAFDIIFAEGQRRYIESLSTYVRQFLRIMSRPDVDLLSGIPPTVAIEQRVSQGGRKSTVATVTEIYHYLRLLYAKLGVQHCYSCGEVISSQTLGQIMDDIERNYKGEKISIFSPMIMGRKGYHKEIFKRAEKLGFSQVRIDGKIYPIKEVGPLERYKEHNIQILTAELEIRESDKIPPYSPSQGGVMRGGDPFARGGENLEKVLEQALKLGRGSFYLVHPERERMYSVKSFCPRCGISFEELDPRLFSFNSKHGACESCDGMGFHWGWDETLIISPGDKSLQEGAVSVFEEERLKRYKQWILKEIKENLKVSLDISFKDLSEEQRKWILYGPLLYPPLHKGGNKGGYFPGIIPMLDSILQDPDQEYLSEYLSQFLVEKLCATCHGKRLKKRALAVKLKGKAIWEITAMIAKEALKFLEGLEFTVRERIIAENIIKEITCRLRFLNEVGLSYLTLDRRSDTLSGGEAQRIRLAAQMGSNLRGVCYILDEPTIGLHPRDNRILLRTLRGLKDKGNTVIIVEHDEETIRNADFIVDLGPGAGVHGGEVVALGDLKAIKENKRSVTGHYLNGRERKKLRKPRMVDKGFITVIKACENNLKGINVSLPLGFFICVTGVSGSGKSTLLKEVIYKGLKKALGQFKGRVGDHEKILGVENIERILEVDQTPIGKTPRSTPSTYVGFYDEIRRLFSLTPEARIRGYTPGRFSFNVKGGRCEKCLGHGKIKVEMAFLPDVYVDCDVCGGRRFNEETLAIVYKGKNVSDVLRMTVEEGVEFFKNFPKIYRPLRILWDMGMGYITLGQASPTLSGGEAQRIKLAYELSKSSKGRTLYIMDEPTTGLHLADIEKLIKVLHSLVDRGNTVLIIEHNMEIIKEADYIIDLGPEGGDEGGEIVACGVPEYIISNEARSYTAQCLREYMEGT